MLACYLAHPGLGLPWAHSLSLWVCPFPQAPYSGNSSVMYMHILLYVISFIFCPQPPVAADSCLKSKLSNQCQLLHFIHSYTSFFIHLFFQHITSPPDTDWIIAAQS